MKNRRSPWVVVALTLMMGVMWLGAARVVAQAPSGVADDASTAWTLPRTPDGQPDLQGVWAHNSVTPLERPPEWAGKERLTDTELAELKRAASRVTESGLDAVFGDQLILAAIEGTKDVDSYDPTTGNYNQFWIVDRDFDNRTSLVVDPPDGLLPALTPDAKQRQEARASHRVDHPADTWTDLPLTERCVTYGVPRLSAGYNSYYQIIQSRDHVVIVMEMIHDARIIPLDGRPHLEGDIRQWHGDARGYWDGDTLVVETTNYSPKSNFMGSSENLRMTERFTRVGPDTLNREVTIQDPTTWTKPWTVSIDLSASEDAIYEYACHEGNYSMEGILAGHRAEEKAAADAAKESGLD